MYQDRGNYVAKEIGKISANYLDKIIIKEDKDRRGKNIGEVAEVINQGVLESKNNIKARIILDEVKALEVAFNESIPGDTIIVFFEKLQPLLDFIKTNQSDDENLGNVANSI